MSDELNNTPESAESPAEETYEGILGDYQEEDAADAPADEIVPEGEAPAPEKKPAGKKVAAIAGICAAVLAVGGLGAFGVIKYRAVMPKNIAATTHGKVTDRMASCYLKDIVNMYVSYYGEEALASYYGLDVTASLKEQDYPMAEGQTWFDFLIGSVGNNISQYLVFKEAGEAMGFQLSDADQQAIEAKLAEADLSTYPAGVTLSDLRSAYELQAYGAGVYKAVFDGFTFTDDEIEAYYNENSNQYVTCGLMGFSVSYDLPKDEEDTTEDETAEGETTADETAADETAAAETAADETTAGDETTAEDAADSDAATEEESVGMDQATAKKLAEALRKANTAELFEQQVSTILTDYEGYSADQLESMLPTISNDNFGYMEGNELADWAFGGEAKVGDTYLIEQEGIYYVYLMTREPSRDESPTINVRHILFNVQDHVNAAGDSPTEEEQAAAMEECHKLAEACLEEWQNGAADEDSFAALANKLSEDPGSNTNGGLYENVTEGQMVDTFNDWCFDASRQTGDTGIVETSYGVHVMFFSGKSDPAWKSNIISTLRSQKFDEWYQEQTSLYPVTVDEELLHTIEG